MTVSSLQALRDALNGVVPATAPDTGVKTYSFIPDHITVKARPVNITGRPFGGLIAQRVVGKHRNNSLLWECLCECGVLCEVPASALTTNKTKSCGCSRSRAKSDWHKENITWNKGKTYQIKKDDEVFVSKKAWTDAAIAKFGNTCQRCGWDAARCDTHHKIARKDGGLNTMENAEVLCPNCHRAEHQRRYAAAAKPKLGFLSVCSGIEAASVAFEPLGWHATAFCEIEAFPSAVLAHHWPEVPNLGDMLGYQSWPESVFADSSLIVGGPPCQAFSVAGLRGGVSDARGGLTLTYVEMINHADSIRKSHGRDPAICIYENVPGLLSDKSNAFGCFLAALAGGDEPLEPGPRPEPGRPSAHWSWRKDAGVHSPKWAYAGVVVGPSRAVAWRILDAQYFGVAQRRRRVFVVASARAGFDPCEVLFEREGVRRDSAPSRETGQDAAANAGPGFDVAGTLDSRVKAGGFPGSDGAMGGHVIPARRDQTYQDVSLCLNAGGMGRIDYESESMVVSTAVPILEAGARTGKSTTDKRAGRGVGEDGDPMYTLQAGKQHAVAVTGDISHTLNTANNGKGSSEGGTGRGTPIIAFSAKDYGGDARENLSPTLRAGGHSGSHANAGVMPAVAHTVALRGRAGGATAELGGEVATALRASSGGGDKPHVLAVHGTQDPCVGVGVEVAFAQGRNNGGENAILQTLAVRRLIPKECERLQGFPDDHTLVAYRNKPAADGPRYKANGNSMAVPVMHWIGRRIQDHLDG